MRINLLIPIAGFIFSLIFILFGRLAIVKCSRVRNTRLVLYKEDKKIVKLGGLVVFVLLVSGLLLNKYLFSDRLSLSISLGSLFMFIIGIIDDLCELKVGQKFFGQLIIVLAFMLFSGLKTEIVFLPKYFNFIITLIWILGITNAFNLLDVEDGLSTGVSFIISLAFLLIAHVTGNTLVGIFALLLSGPLLAVLIFNFPPAKIYLGDSGSLFLGFVFGVLAISISYASPGHELALLSPFFILGFPIYDTAFVSLMRIFRKKPIFIKTEDHFVMKLIAGGKGRIAALLICYFLTVFFAALGIIFTKLPHFYSLALIPAVVIFFIFLLFRVGRIKI